MPYRVEVSVQANRDLDRIYRYIEAATSEKAAEVTRETPLLRHLLYGNKPHIYRAIYFVNQARGTSRFWRSGMAPGAPSGQETSSCRNLSPRSSAATNEARKYQS